MLADKETTAQFVREIGPSGAFYSVSEDEARQAVIGSVYEPSETGVIINVKIVPGESAIIETCSHFGFCTPCREGGWDKRCEIPIKERQG